MQYGSRIIYQGQGEDPDEQKGTDKTVPEDTMGTHKRLQVETDMKQKLRFTVRNRKTEEQIRFTVKTEKDLDTVEAEIRKVLE